MYWIVNDRRHTSKTGSHNCKRRWRFRVFAELQPAKGPQMMAQSAEHIRNPKQPKARTGHPLGNMRGTKGRIRNNRTMYTSTSVGTARLSQSQRHHSTLFLGHARMQGLTQIQLRMWQERELSRHLCRPVTASVRQTKQRCQSSARQIPAPSKWRIGLQCQTTVLRTITTGVAQHARVFDR
jgi:hypothetical protein